jgi:hypothetical protein
MARWPIRVAQCGVLEEHGALKDPGGDTSSMPVDRFVHGESQKLEFSLNSECLSVRDYIYGNMLC